MNGEPQRPLRRFALLLGVAALATGVAVSGCPAWVTRPQPLGTSAPAAGSLLSVTGCTIDTLLYNPERPKTDALVVLGHGFLRGQGRMAGLAEALAAAGVPTVTLDFCNSRPWDGRHVQNGRDMRRVADRLGARRVVYAGFSAGGLSALVAAWDDPRAVGVLTLDLVDDRGLGAGLARTLQVPILGLQGEPAPCNAQANGLKVFAASPRGQVLAIANAIHCDFESPTDWLCESICGGPDSGSEERRREVVARSVALTMGLLGLEAPTTLALPPPRDQGAPTPRPGPQT